MVSCKLAEGPIPMGVASGITVNAEAEWASLLPLADGVHQIVRGLTVPQVTQDMDEINLQKLFESIKKKCVKNKEVKNLKVPKIVGGRINMILGIKYQNIYPQPVHHFPNGLTVFKSQLLPAFPGAIAYIGGPVSALNNIAGALGGQSAIKYMSSLLTDLGKYRSKVDLFPGVEMNGDMIDHDIPDVNILIEEKVKVVGEEINEKVKVVEDIEKKIKVVKENIDEDGGVEVNGDVCYVCGATDIVVDHTSAAVQSELQKFLKLQDAGLRHIVQMPAL